MKAIVLSSDENGSVLLGDDGIVYESPALYGVGDTVNYTPKRSWHVLRKTIAVAASVLLMVTGIFTYSYQNIMVYATVRVDQLPGVEFLLNRKNQVVNIVGTTSSAKRTVKLLKEGGASRVEITKCLERSSKLTHTDELSVRVDCDDEKGMKIVENETSLVAAVISVNDQDTGNGVQKPALEKKDGKDAKDSGAAEEAEAGSSASGSSGSSSAAAASAAAEEVSTAPSAQGQQNAAARPAAESAPAYGNTGRNSYVPAAPAVQTQTPAVRKPAAAVPAKAVLSDEMTTDPSVSLHDEKSPESSGQNRAEEVSENQSSVQTASREKNAEAGTEQRSEE